MKFTLKSRTFLLELLDYGLNQCFCHKCDSIICVLDIKRFLWEGLVGWDKIVLG